MIKKYKTIKALSICLMASFIWFVVSCNKDDASSNKIRLDSFGPSFLMRGEQLKFIGNGLDKVTAVVLPNNVQVTEFATKTSNLLVIDVPNETVDGFVTLKTPQGDILTKTQLVISEPITIAALSPSTVRTGDKLTITGTYLDLVASVKFNSNLTVTDFVSQSPTKIEVIVPNAAQTGAVILGDGQKIPNQIKSKTDLSITLPAITQISPQPVKAGSNLTITGTNLDLVTDLLIDGGILIDSSQFVKPKSQTQIVIKIPDTAKEGLLKIRPLSHVEISTDFKLIASTVSSVTPAQAKNKGTITVTGTDLDLVSQVIFGGGKSGTIQTGGTSTQITVSVPADAKEGKVKFGTKADKWDSTKSITLVKPAITSFTPSVNTIDKPSITINGSDLDLVASVRFGGGWVSKDVTVNSASQIVVKVTPGSVSGAFTLITTNGTEITSSGSFTIVPDVPNVTSISPAASFALGDLITLNGTNMNVLSTVVFPNGQNGITATEYGSKSSTAIQVMVPIGTKKGRIKLVNYANEVYEVPIDITILGVEPVQDPALVFFDFDSKGAWWGDVQVQTNPSLADDGTKYGEISASYDNAWHDLFWRNQIGSFNGATTVGTNVNNYVIKFDIQVVQPITAGEIKFRLHGDEGDFFYAYGPGGGMGTIPATTGWTTVTIPISSFKSGANSPTDMSKVTAEYGAAFENGNGSPVNFRIDNIRFHKIN